MADTTIRAGIRIQTEVQGEEQIQHLNQSIGQVSNGNRDLSTTTQQLSRHAQQTNQQFDEFNQTLNQTDHKMTPLAQSIGKIGMAAAGAVGGFMALKQGLSDVLNATQEYQAIAARFTYAFDGAEQGVQQLEFIRQEANRLGLEFMGAADGYAQFAAAAKDLNITTEQTQSVFKGVASAAAAMGLSADDANGVFLALSQIAGKGKVSMEELRGQLGERLAPAMSIAAQAMDVTTAELEKMVENGLAAETFLPKFGAALEQAFSKDAAANAQSLSGQINLLKNSYNEFLIKLGEGGIGAATITVLQDIGKALDYAKEKFDQFSQSENGEYLKQTLSDFYDLIKEIGNTTIQVFQIAKDNVNDFGSALSGSKNEIDLIQAVLNGVNLTVGAIRDGVSAVGIAFNVFSGAAKDLLAFLADGMSKITFGDFSASLKQAANELRQAADENYQTAHQSAMNFESQTAKVLQNMAEHANSASQVYNQATVSIAQSIDETAKAEGKARELSQAYKDVQTAASSFGLDMRAAMNEPTPAMLEMQGNLAKLAVGFDELTAEGVDAADLLGQAIDKMTETAKNQADIELLKSEIQKLGETGKLSLQDVEWAILAADQKLNQLKQSADPTAQAFEKLGIKTREAMRLSAEETRLAFEAVEQSGEAVSGSLKEKFAQVAQDLLATGDANQQAWVQSKAAAYDYTVVVDNSGKMALQAAAQTQKAAQQQVQAHQQATQAAQQANATQQQNANNSTKELKKATVQVIQFSEETRTAFKLFKGGGVWAWIQKLNQSLGIYKEVNLAIKNVNASLENGVDLAQSLAAAESLAQRHADILGKKTLSNLRKAISDARQKMSELANEAARAANETEKELLRIQGKDDEVAKMELQERISELQQQKEIAEKQGNSKAISAYNKAIENVKRTEFERQQRESEERIAEELRLRQEREQQTKQIADTPIDVNVNADLSGLIDVMKSKIQAGSQDAVEQVLKTLTDAMMQQR